MEERGTWILGSFGLCRGHGAKASSLGFDCELIQVTVCVDVCACSLHGCVDLLSFVHCTSMN